MSKRFKFPKIEGTPIDVSGWYKDQKEREETELKRKIDEQKLEEERIKKIKCPVCKSTDKIVHIKSNNNGVMGPGFSSWITDEYLICKDCGIHYSDISKLKK